MNSIWPVNQILEDFIRRIHFRTYSQKRFYTYIQTTVSIELTGWSKMGHVNHVHRFNFGLSGIKMSDLGRKKGGQLLENFRRDGRM